MLLRFFKRFLFAALLFSFISLISRDEIGYSQEREKKRFINRNDPAASNFAAKKNSKKIIVLSQPSVVEQLRARVGFGQPGFAAAQANFMQELNAAAVSVYESQRAVESLVSRRGIKVLDSSQISVNALLVDGSITKEELDRLYPGAVRGVYENGEVKASLAESIPAMKVDRVWLRPAPNGGVVRGQGLRIGIIDTGIEYTHPDFGGCARTANLNSGSCAKVPGGYDFISNDNDPFDDHGHGTHVAGIAAGNGALVGVAPDALLYAYKVLDEFGSGDDFTVIKAVERSIDPNGDGNPQDHLDVINLSLGGPGNSVDPLSLAVDNAVAAGVVVVTAAGNEGPANESIGSPAAARNSITVGAETKAHELIYFSSRGPVWYRDGDTLVSIQKPDIIAPGVDICAARASADRSSAGRNCTDSRHVLKSGTSMAAPHIAGLAALLKQAHPTWTPEQIKTAMRQTAEISADNEDYQLSQQGFGSVNAELAVDYSGLLGLSANDLRMLPEAVKFAAPSQGLNGFQLRISAARRDALFYITAQDWRTIYSGSADNFITANSEANINNLAQDDYVIRAELLQGNTPVFTDYNTIRIERYNFDGLDSGQVINGVFGHRFRINSRVTFQPDTLTLRAILSNGDEIDLPISGPAFEAEIKFPGLVNREILTVEAYIGHHGISDFIYADSLIAEPNLKAGFPVKIDSECDGTRCAESTFKEPVAFDFDHDNKKEIVTLRSTNSDGPNEVVIVDSQGSIIRSFQVPPPPPVPNTKLYTSSDSSLLVSDLDGDNEGEIIVVSENYREIDDNSGISLTIVSVVNQFGSQRPGFPVVLEESALELAPIVADLNRDSRKEIVIGPLLRNRVNVQIVDATGNLMNNVALGENGLIFGGTVDRGRHPVLGNFDDDSDLEVAVFLRFYAAVGNNSAEPLHNIYIVNWDHSDGEPIKPLYSVKDASMPGTAVSQDLTGDGRQEIVFPLTVYDSIQDEFFSAVHAVSYNGTALPGYPIRINNHPLGCSGQTGAVCEFYEPSFSSVFWPGVTDRIITGGAGDYFDFVSQQHAFSQNGFLPLVTTKLPDVFFSSEALNADVTGDGVPDLIVEAKAWDLLAEDRGIHIFTSESNFADSKLLNTEQNFYLTPSDSAIVDDFDGDGLVDILTDGILNQESDYFSLFMFKTPATSIAGSWTRWRGSNDRHSCADCSLSAIRSYEDKPRIIEHPASVEVPVGATTKLAVNAQGGTLQYEWQHYSDLTGIWGSVNSTSNSLEVAGTYEGQFDRYRVIVKNNSHRIYSNEASVLTIADQCPSDLFKSAPGICGCGTPDIDANANSDIDCVEIEKYKNLPRAKLKRSKKKAGQVTVELPTRDVTRYEISFTEIKSKDQGKPKTKKVKSKKANFVAKGIAAGKYKISYTLFPRGLPGLTSAKGPSSKFNMK